MPAFCRYRCRLPRSGGVFLPAPAPPLAPFAIVRGETRRPDECARARRRGRRTDKATHPVSWYRGRAGRRETRSHYNTCNRLCSIPQLGTANCTLRTAGLRLTRTGLARIRSAPVITKFYGSSNFKLIAGRSRHSHGRYRGATQRRQIDTLPPVGELAARDCRG